MTHSYIIIDDNSESVLHTKAAVAPFEDFVLVATADNYEDGVDVILEHRPQLVFLAIGSDNRKSDLSLNLINELYRFLSVVPKIIITAPDSDHALAALKFGVFDYMIQPMTVSAFRKTASRLQKEHFPVSETSSPILEIPVIVSASSDEEIVDERKDQPVTNSPIALQAKPIASKPLIICVKSYGDYRFIDAADICYLQADNNSTDIHLFNGEMITAFKTLKHFEGVLSSPFIRIHNSYIVNIDYVSRIHTGNSVCYIKNTTTKLPFSKSYKENVDSIINSITTGNYLEI